MSAKILFGFHAVTVRLKTAPESILEIHVDATRRDARMRQFMQRAEEAGAKLVESDDQRLIRLGGSPRHQGVVAKVNPIKAAHSLDDVLDEAEAPPLVLVLDGVTDPHNLGACLRPHSIAKWFAPSTCSSGTSPSQKTSSNPLQQAARLGEF